MLLAPFSLSAGTSVNSVSYSKTRFSLGPACGGAGDDGTPAMGIVEPLLLMAVASARLQND